MSAIADHKARLAKAKTATPASAPVDEAHRLFTELGTLLYMAAETDEVPDGSGYSDRLLRIAADLAEEAASESWIGRNFKNDGAHPWVDHKAFDIAALVSSAMKAPGDICSDARRALYSQIRVILVVLTECQNCLYDTPIASGSSSDERDQRIALVELMSLEFTSWIQMLRPAAMEAFKSSGCDPETAIDWVSIGPVVFERLQDMASAMGGAFDVKEMPLTGLEKFVRHGIPLSETTNG